MAQIFNAEVLVHLVEKRGVGVEERAGRGRVKVGLMELVTVRDGSR